MDRADGSVRAGAERNNLEAQRRTSGSSSGETTADPFGAATLAVATKELGTSIKHDASDNVPFTPSSDTVRCTKVPSINSDKSSSTTNKRHIFSGV